MLGTTAAMSQLSGATATGVVTSEADAIAKTTEAGAIGAVGTAAVGTTVALRTLAKTTVIGAIALIALSVALERGLHYFGVWNDTDLISDFNNDILNIADNVNNMDVQWENLIPEDLIDSLDAGTDSMAKFNSGREEMFMGFKAGAVTGDLVKQVQQGGVENFVANTEIIMNNNFSGLTTDELAREVISQIQRTATGNGIIVN